MKNIFKITAFLSAILMLTGCSTQVEKSSIEFEGTDIDSDLVLASETDTESTTEYDPSVPYAFDVQDVLNSDSFKNCYDVLTYEGNAFQLKIDISGSNSRYVGSPFQYAAYHEDGHFSQKNIIMFPVMSYDKAAAIINISLNDDGTYHGNCSEGIADRLNELLESGKSYALVTAEYAEIGYAVSEDDEVEVIFDYTYSEDTDLSPDISYAEASQFNNVVAKDTLTTKVEF